MKKKILYEMNQVINFNKVNGIDPNLFLIQQNYINNVNYIKS